MRQDHVPWNIGAKGENHIRISFPNDKEGVPLTEHLNFEVQCEGEETEFCMPIHMAIQLVNTINQFVDISEMHHVATAVAKLEESDEI